MTDDEFKVYSEAFEITMERYGSTGNVEEALISFIATIQLMSMSEKTEENGMQWVQNIFNLMNSLNSNNEKET